MAVQAAPAKTEAPKRGRTKKGEGPYTIAFVDAESKEFPRIPETVSQIKITDKKGNTKTFGLEFPPTVLRQLAADGLRRRLDAYMRNGVDGDKSPVVLADEMYANIKAGKIYTKADGKTGAGRTFDFDLWVACIQRLADLKHAADPKKHKKATKDQLQSLRTKLETATPQQRKEMLAKWNKDAQFVLAKKQIDAERAATNAKDKSTDYDALADAF